MSKKGLLAVCVSMVFLAGCATSHAKKTETMSHPAEYEMSQAPALQETVPPVQETAASSESAQPVDPMKMSKKDVQTALKNAGFYQGKLDGVFGPKTRVAIKAFQKANGLQADGLAGKQTRAALSKFLK